MTGPSDLDRARRWYVEQHGVITARDDFKVASLARLLTETRGTLIDLCDLQTRALLAVEWNPGADDGAPNLCPWCGGEKPPAPKGYHYGHTNSCQFVAVMKESGLPTQADRDAMRAEMAVR